MKKYRKPTYEYILTAPFKDFHFIDKAAHLNNWSNRFNSTSTPFPFNSVGDAIERLHNIKHHKLYEL